MIRRRTFAMDEGAGQLIVTYDDVTDEMIVGHRKEAWEEWSRPLAQIGSEDDSPGRTRGLAPVNQDVIIEQMRALVAAHDEQAASPAAAARPDPASMVTVLPGQAGTEYSTGPERFGAPQY